MTWQRRRKKKKSCCGEYDGIVIWHIMGCDKWEHCRAVDFLLSFFLFDSFWGTHTRNNPRLSSTQKTRKNPPTWWMEGCHHHSLLLSIFYHQATTFLNSTPLDLDDDHAFACLEPSHPSSFLSFSHIEWCSMLPTSPYLFIFWESPLITASSVGSQKKLRFSSISVSIGKNVTLWMWLFCSI